MRVRGEQRAVSVAEVEGRLPACLPACALFVDTAAAAGDVSPKKIPSSPVTAPTSFFFRLSSMNFNLDNLCPSDDGEESLCRVPLPVGQGSHFNRPLPPFPPFCREHILAQKNRIDRFVQKEIRLRDYKFPQYLPQRTVQMC